MPAEGVGRAWRLVGLVLRAATIVLGLGGARQTVDAQQPPALQQLTLCGTCHGANGTSTMPNTPSLAGHPVLYTQMQLFLFREGQRAHEVMNAVTKGMSDETITALAEYYAKLPAAPSSSKADAAMDARGRELSASHRCGTCHLPDYAGRDQMARLAGQREDYLLKALRDYKTGARSGDGAQMASVVYGLNDDDFKALAHHIAHIR